MKEHIEVFVFRDASFAPSGDTLVCIAEKSAMERFISKKEVSWAFSGCATYRRRPWKTYVGVWGRKNASRFRRFLRERGAEIAINQEAPEGVRLAYYSTDNERRRIRSLPGNLLILPSPKP